MAESLIDSIVDDNAECEVNKTDAVAVVEPPADPGYRVYSLEEAAEIQTQPIQPSVDITDKPVVNENSSDLEPKEENKFVFQGSSIAAASSKKTYMYADLVIDDNDKYLCPECGHPHGSRAGMIGLFTHLRVAHKINPNFIGVPSTRGMGLRKRKIKEAPVPVKLESKLELEAKFEVTNPKALEETLSNQYEKQFKSMLETIEGLNTRIRELENRPQTTQVIQPQDDLKVVIRQLDAKLAAILSPRSLKYIDKSYVEGIVTAKQLLAESLWPFMPDLSEFVFDDTKLGK